VTEPAADPDPAAVFHTPPTAADRVARRVRILARLEEGWSYDKIGDMEGLTRERVRQIVVESLRQREVDPSYEHALMQSARLDPALRLAAEKVAEGDLRAVVPMLRVLDRLDKYQAAAIAHRAARETQERTDRSLHQKLNDMFNRIAAAQKAEEAAAREREAKADGAQDSQAFSPANH
jgi:hypothetical protein